MDIEELCFRIDILLAENASKGLPQVDMLELIKSGVPYDGLKDKLRFLVRCGRYRGSVTVNGIPILLRKETT